MSKLIDRTGEVYVFQDGRNMEIIEYFSAHNITVKFCDGGVVYGKMYSDFIKGNIKDLNKPYYCGIGFVGYGGYGYKNNKEAYMTWTKMIARCYDDKTHIKRPTYKNCTVHPDWHNFQNFAKWFYENYIDGFHLDKDLLIKGNRVYSDKTCVFIPQEINALISISRLKKSSCPTGVSELKNGFQSGLYIGGRRENLGLFKTQEEAFYAYKENKIKEVKRIAHKYKAVISLKAYSALMGWVVDIND